MSMALLCSCNNTEIVSYDNNNNPEITQKNTYSSDVEKITNDENMEYTRENLNDEFIYINDVSAVDELIYISGRKETVYTNQLIVGSQKYEFENRRYSTQKFINDTMYCMYLNNENNISITSVDISGNLKDIPLEGNSEDFCVGLSGKIYFYNSKNKSVSSYCNEEILSSDNNIKPTKFPVKIECDDKENVYLFYVNENNEFCLEKYDSNLNVIYSNSDFSDMQGEISDIKYIGNDKLEISVNDFEDNIKYTNTISTNTGNTIERNNLDSIPYNDGSPIIWKSSSGESVYIEESANKPQYSTIIYDIYGNKKDEIEYILNNDGFINKVFIDNSGKVYYIENCYNPVYITDDSSFEYAVHIIDTDKQHKSFSFFSDEINYYVDFIASDSMGNIFIGGNDDSNFTISIYDETGENITTKIFSDVHKFDSISVCGDKLYVCYFANDEHLEISYISTKKQDLSNPKLNITDLISVLRSNKKDEIIFRNSNGISSYNLNSGVENEIFNFNSIGIDEYEWMITIYDEDTLIKYNEDKCFIIQNSNQEKVELNLAVTYLPEKIEKYILDFNSSNNDYRINVHQYSYGEESYNNMNLDLISGKIDVIISDSSFNVEEYDKDIFYDLNEFIKQDSDINDDNYFCNIIDLYSYNGKIYEIVPEFLLYVMYVCDDNITSDLLWSQNEFLDFISAENGLSKAPAYKLPLILRCLSCKYINYETGSCNFTDKNFLKVLELTGKNLSFDEIVPVDQVQKEIIGREYKLLTEEYNNSLWLPESEKNNVKIKGLPDDNKAGIVVSPYFGLSILNNSEHKQEAWDFIRYYISDEYQKCITSETFNIPLSRNVWKEHIKTPETSEYMKQISETVISNANYRDYAINSKVYQILEQVYTAYSSGNITANDAVKEMQSKTELYLKERNYSDRQN